MAVAGRREHTDPRGANLCGEGDRSWRSDWWCAATARGTHLIRQRRASPRRPMSPKWRWRWLPRRRGARAAAVLPPGVGTTRSDRLLGGAFGAGLFRDVCDTYRFVVQNYQPGDELYFFGFSRGAFTARSTAGLIRNSGSVAS